MSFDSDHVALTLLSFFQWILVVRYFTSATHLQGRPSSLSQWCIFHTCHIEYMPHHIRPQIMIQIVLDSNLKHKIQICCQSAKFRDTVSELTCRSSTCNCEWRTCPRSLRGS